MEKKMEDFSLTACCFGQLHQSNRYECESLTWHSPKNPPVHPYLCKLTLIQCPQSPSHEWCQCLHTVSLCHSMQSWFRCQYKDVVGGQPMSSPCADRPAPWHAWWMCCKPRLQTPPVHQKQESNYIHPASHTQWCSKLVFVTEQVSKTNLTCLQSKRHVSIGTYALIYKPRFCYLWAEGSAGPQTPYHVANADTSDVWLPSECLHTGWIHLGSTHLLQHLVWEAILSAAGRLYTSEVPRASVRLSTTLFAWLLYKQLMVIPHFHLDNRNSRFPKHWLQLIFEVAECPRRY